MSLKRKNYCSKTGWWFNHFFSVLFGMSPQFLNKWLKPPICCNEQRPYDFWFGLTPSCSWHRACLCTVERRTFNRSHKTINLLRREALSGAAKLPKRFIYFHISPPSCQRKCRSKSWTEQRGPRCDSHLYSTVYFCVVSMTALFSGVIIVEEVGVGVSMFNDSFDIGL